MIYHFTVCMKQGGNQNNDASMPIEVISCFRGKGSLFPPVSLAINRFHLKDEISVVRYSFKSNHRQKSRTFRARKQLSAVYRITLRNNRISREFNIAAITPRSAKKSVSYHDLYNLSTTDHLFDENKKKRRPASKSLGFFEAER